MGTPLQELSDDELQAEYLICTEELSYHNEQVGHVKAELHRLTRKLTEKKQERDVHVNHYEAIKNEYTRRKQLKRKKHQSLGKINA